MRRTCVPRSALGPLRSALLALVTLAPSPAGAGCVTEREARDLERSLRDAVVCRHDAWKGRGGACAPRPAPACAGTLPTDTLALAYGPNDPPAGAVDGDVLGQQLRCQKKIGGAAASYVGKRLRALQRGKEDPRAEKAARRKLDHLARHCDVSVVRDAGGVVLPAVGPQCAAAVGDAGRTVDSGRARRLPGALLGDVGGSVGPDPQPLRPNILFILTDDQRWDTTDATHSLGRHAGHARRDARELGGCRRRVPPTPS